MVTQSSPATATPLMRRLESAQRDCLDQGQTAAAILLQDAMAEISRLRDSPQSAPALQAPQNTAERMPNSDAALAGADTRPSAEMVTWHRELIDREPDHGQYGKTAAPQPSSAESAELVRELRLVAVAGDVPPKGHPSLAQRAADEIERLQATALQTMDCPQCGRRVLSENRIGEGFIAKCGRRLAHLSECGAAPQVCRECTCSQDLTDTSKLDACRSVALSSPDRSTP